MKEFKCRIVFVFSVISLFLITTGCSHKHDGKYVKDSEGNVYKLEWCIGKAYFLKEVNISEIDSLNIKR